MNRQRVLLLPRHVVPVRPRGEVLHGHGVLVEDGRITGCWPRSEAIGRAGDAERVDLDSHALIPGLINTHTHAAMNLLRGWADDRDLQVWLNEHIWPAERRWVGPEFVRDGSRLAIAEMIRGGQTCFNDNYFFPEVTAECTREAGLRATIGIPVLESPNPWTSDFAESLRRGEALVGELDGDPLLRVALAPHAPYSVSDPALARIREVAETHGLRIHMHVLETDWEIGHSKREFGLRPLQRLDAAGVLDGRLIAVHMTQLGGPDIALLAERGVHVVHCPESNLKLASGICPVAALLDAGVNVALGTDGAASNNDLDLMGEARTAALLAKVNAGDPQAVPASTALEMLTLGGARALGIDDEVGSIEPGKQADLAAIDLDCLEAQPLHDVISQLVYAAPRCQVTDVWVAGRPVMRSRELLTLDESALLDTAADWQQRLLDGMRRVGSAAS